MRGGVFRGRGRRAGSHVSCDGAPSTRFAAACGSPPFGFQDRDQPMSPQADIERALARAIEATGTRDFMGVALDYLRATLPFVGIFAVMLNGRRPPVHLYDNVRAEKRAAIIDRYLDGAYLLDPFYEACCQHPGDRVLVLEDVAPDRFHQTPYFRGYYRATNLQDEVAVLVQIDARKHVFYSLGRRLDEPRFRARELRALKRALPVFAALNRRHYAGSARDLAWPAESLDAEHVRFTMEHFGAEVLTSREREIAALILKGHSSKSVARVIDVSPGTVKIHRKNIYRKLSVSSQSELFALFLDALTR